ncbi:uncharacterized protein LOC126629021 [Malus sylvestris]|uniref:uncharacterized protein LOC126629021 n=1 Tax=Malus sylvestris TaxID=3752 RepID=UPI0021ACC5BA|nr:uncharacterized protein LOC126629021 [Malus sylvestris]
MATDLAAIRDTPLGDPTLKDRWSKVSHLSFVGMVVRAEGGRFFAAARYSIKAPSVASAEAMTLLRGYELGTSLGLTSVILESDSRESISYISGSLDSGSWEAFPILACVKQISGAFQHCRWSWVSRSSNMTANFLASRHFTEMCDCVWVDRPPFSLVHVLNMDGCLCAFLGVCLLLGILVTVGFSTLE